MFESIVREAASRFHLGDNAGRFVQLLLDAIFDPASGGFAGLRDRFEHAGLGDLFASWIGTTPGDNVLQPDQFATGFGATAGDIPGKLGIPTSAVNMAGAFLLPKIIGLLTPGGQIPSGRPAWLDGAFGGAGMVAGAPSAVDPARGVAFATRDGAAAASGGGIWKWLIPLLLLAAAFFGYRSCHRQAADTTPAAEATTPAANATADAATASAMAPASDINAMPAENATTAMPASATMAMPAADANATADAALSGIKSGASTEEVTKALNLMIIHFATGSANIDHDSDAILKKAADAIKSLPADTKLEVGGHTDNTGNAAANMSLSQNRADAVVARLGELGVAAGMLGGKGYGDTTPVADNSTAEGRAQNRRIEFTAAP